MGYPCVQLLFVAFTPVMLIPEKLCSNREKSLHTKIMKTLHMKDVSSVRQHARLGGDDQVVKASRFPSNRKCTRGDGRTHGGVQVESLPSLSTSTSAFKLLFDSRDVTRPR